MKYQHILSYVASTLWGILPAKFHELLAVLASRAAGHEFTAAEIRARIGDNSESSELSQQGMIAIVPLRGVIAHRMGGMQDSSGGMSTERFQAMFRQAMANEQVHTIVIDVDSPGGTIPGVQEAAAEVFAARGQGKRIVAVANSLCASAAYWLASQADEIVCIPSGLVGSIGVFTAHEDLSAMLEKEGIDITLISAGKFKTEGNPFEKLSEDGKAHLQGRVNDAYAQFTADVARGRGVSVKDVQDGYGQGRALAAKDAKKAGLIDRIETMDALLAREMKGRKAARGGIRAEMVERGGVLGYWVDESTAPTAASTKLARIEMAQRVEAFQAANPELATADADADRRRRLERF